MPFFARWIVQVFNFCVVAFNPVSDQFANVVNIIFLPGTLGTRASDPARDFKAQLWETTSERKDREKGFINMKSCRYPPCAEGPEIGCVWNILCILSEHV